MLNYQYEQNVHSDSQFLQEALEAEAVHGESVIIVADGAYAGGKNQELAKEKNIELVTTNGRLSMRITRGVHQFIDEDTTAVLDENIDYWLFPGTETEKEKTQVFAEQGYESVCYVNDGNLGRIPVSVYKLIKEKQ